MSGVGAGDRRGPLFAFRSDGDRPRVRISTRRAHLVGLELQRVAVADLVVDDVPDCVMYAGRPFLISGDPTQPILTYLEIRPYRVDAMIISEAE